MLRGIQTKYLNNYYNNNSCLSLIVRRGLGTTTSMDERKKFVLEYHERSKHAPKAYALGPGRLDWNSQPNPFRRYSECKNNSLLGENQKNDSLYNSIYFMNGKTPNQLTSCSLSQFLFYSLSLSAWKGHGESSWSLRVNPSSGNLHPTEAYLFIPPINGVAEDAGIWHYAPKDHSIENRVSIAAETWNSWMQHLPPNSFFVCLSSIYWREAWKYGERAFRYCQHDTGHALACLRLSASMQGWRLQVLPEITTSDLARLFGFSRKQDFHEKEEEHPHFLAIVSPLNEVPPPIEWKGKANKLSQIHKHHWDIIDSVSLAAEKTEAAAGSSLWSPYLHKPFNIPSDLYYAMASNVTAAKIIRQRRSAVDMDGTTSITKEQFYGMLMRTMPSITQAPWDSFPYEISVHLGIFVHRVDGLPPGLYTLVRDPAQVENMKTKFHPQFQWISPPDSPPNLPLYLLHQQDVTKIAAVLSCVQEIAGNGAFSLGMFADMSKIETSGPHTYPILFWETGMIGQVLYLEAEAQGVRATGIGCFFDNEVHGIFNLQPPFQSLYHFTVGGPIEDTRIRTMGGYESHGIF